jgi:hypothetical protein
MFDMSRFEKHEKDGIETERFAEMLLVSGNYFLDEFVVLVLKIRH